MRFHGRLPLRLVAWLATSSLCLTTVSPARAQPVAPASADQAGEQGIDPPTLAGRLAALNGSVSFHAAGETQWNAATLNYPVTTGEAFWTEPRAGATLEIADNRLVMDDSTELDVITLNQTQLAATEPQGAVFLQLTTLPSGPGVSFNTPRGTVQITAPGRYEIVAGDTNDATMVTVVEGAAHVAGANLSLDIGPEQMATISGSDTLQGSVGAMQQDSFLQSQLGAPARRVATALPPQARYMTGAADLQQYGSFSPTAQYGQVWYPNDVARDWAPYRDGHWAYVQPWGWTWVDNARWGFAPFHYGRWIQVNDRWGWVAGGGEGAEVSAYPVYSPALVSFVDVGGAALAGAAIGFAAAEFAGGYAPAWIPLGPREPYYPWYHCRPDYFGRVNSFYGVPRDIIARGPIYVNDVTNIRQVNINRTTVFINRGAATVSPAGAFARGQSLMGVARPLPERVLAQARPVVGRLPVRPTAFTPNLPPTAARRFNISMPARPVRPIAAGPVIEPVRAGHAGPVLRQAALPGNIRAISSRLVEGRPGSPIAPGGIRQPVGGFSGLSSQGGRALGSKAPEEKASAHGPVAGPRGPGGLPALRAPGGRPEALPQGGAPMNSREQADRSRGPGALTPRSERGVRPGNAARPPVAAEQRPRVPQTRPDGLRPAPRMEATRPTPRPIPHVDAPRPASRPEVLRPEAPRTAPRPETPRPALPTEAPHPSPRREVSRPASPPKPAPHQAPPQGKHEPRH